MFGRRKVTFDEKIYRFKAIQFPSMFKLADRLGFKIDILSVENRQDEVRLKFTPSQEDQASQYIEQQLLPQPSLREEHPKQNPTSKPKTRIRRTKAEIEAAKAQPQEEKKP